MARILYPSIIFSILIIAFPNVNWANCDNSQGPQIESLSDGPSGNSNATIVSNTDLFLAQVFIPSIHIEGVTVSFIFSKTFNSQTGPKTSLARAPPQFS